MLYSREKNKSTLSEYTSGVRGGIVFYISDYQLIYIYSNIQKEPNNWQALIILQLNKGKQTEL
jgi:hypothetical protein